MTINEFKKHCKNRNYYVAQIYVIEEEIKRIDILMGKPRAPRLEVIGAPAHNYDPKIVDFIARKQELEKEKQKYIDRVEYVDSIRSLPKPWNDIYWKTLVEGLPARNIARDYGISKDKYYRSLNKFIGGLLCLKKTD
jgi:hypothetical protein